MIGSKTSKKPKYISGKSDFYVNMKKSHEPFWSLTASGPHSLPLNGNEELRRSDKRLPQRKVSLNNDEYRDDDEYKMTKWFLSEPSLQAIKMNEQLETTHILVQM